ncbi:proline hydroxylase [Elstera litoralis]|uniref:Proline hydroxylase n=1 Tax=Elstera litoralis TaxID=552518 RepID=A0A0F3INZ8_9PROT|nr:2OG-Fe(II) oxygenase [Elstera litoralis]KJV08347.1 proline hydroxylase [Elstera litoralis]
MRAAPPTGNGRFLPHYTQESWLPAALADGVLGYAIGNEGQFRSGSILHNGTIMVDDTIRQVSVLEHLGPFHAPVAEAALAAAPGLAARFGIPAFTASRVEIELAAHGDGAHFQQHIDTFVVVNQRPNPRVLTLVLYLNRQPRPFTGGALRFHALGGTATQDIAPDHNRLAAFPSIAPHSVQRLTCSSRAFADRRFAVNMWIHR